MVKAGVPALVKQLIRSSGVSEIIRSSIQLLSANRCRYQFCSLFSVFCTATQCHVILCLADVFTNLDSSFAKVILNTALLASWLLLISYFAASMISYLRHVHVHVQTM